MLPEVNVRKLSLLAIVVEVSIDVHDFAGFPKRAM